MTVRNVSQAKAELSALLVAAENGEDVVISRAGKPIARLVPIKVLSEPRKLGVLAGKIWISPDFEDLEPPLEQWTEAPIEPAH
jgi:prevent-host-death family protein